MAGGSIDVDFSPSSSAPARVALASEGHAYGGDPCCRPRGEAPPTALTPHDAPLLEALSRQGPGA
jgi:hypothetical protein